MIEWVGGKFNPEKFDPNKIVFSIVEVKNLKTFFADVSIHPSEEVADELLEM